MNPPTIGHSKLLSALYNLAGENDSFLFLSHSAIKPAEFRKAAKTESLEEKAGILKNPLSWKDKMEAIDKIYKNKFPKMMFSDLAEIRTISDALNLLAEKGYTDVTLVCGGDRISSFETFFQRYAADVKTPDFNEISIESAGERDPDSEGVDGMSATKLRLSVLEDDIATFQTGIDTDDMSIITDLFEKCSAGMQAI